jgi:hypothetical protein
MSQLNFIGVGLAMFLLPASASVLYVDLNSLDPTPPFASLSTAAVTIQEAVDAATNGDLILVNNGVYQAGFQTSLSTTGISETTETNRLVVDKPVTVQSLNGPTLASISGSGIYRSVFLTNGAALNGFTLANGAAGYKEVTGLLTKTVAEDGGGVCGSEFGGGVVSNCVLTANSATSYGGGAYLVTLVNCHLTGNSASIGAGQRIVLWLAAPSLATVPRPTKSPVQHLCHPIRVAALMTGKPSTVLFQATPPGRAVVAKAGSWSIARLSTIPQGSTGEFRSPRVAPRPIASFISTMPVPTTTSARVPPAVWPWITVAQFPCRPADLTTLPTIRHLWIFWVAIITSLRIHQ